MKRIFVIAGLATAFLLLVVAASAQKTNFAGTWSLDKAKSQNLSRGMQGADKVTLTITQDDKTIGLDTKLEGGQPPAGGGGGNGGGGGGGRGMGGGFGGPQSFNLDGKENGPTDVTMGQRTIKRTTKGTLSGQSVELWTKSEFAGQDGSMMTTTSTQKLTLSDGGKTLTSVTHREGGQQQAPDVTAVYTKQ
jgi:hypothetical protein